MSQYLLQSRSNDSVVDEVTPPDGAGSSVVADPSLLLYLAGLSVTLSGLYAVNYASLDTTFTALTFGLAICGYLFSYVLRMRRVSVQSLHTPMLVVIGLAILAMLSSERGLGWLLPQGMGDDRARALQFVFAWLAIVHSFLLANDAAVLFSCVPCMTMLALVSTKNSEPDVQNAFLIFIGASTFMMVHENYLRTRLAQAQGRSRGRDGRLFGGQLQLTALCLVGALVLANFVAMPIQTIGQTLFDSGALTPASQHITTIQNNLASVAANRGERDKIDIGSGPVGESDVEIMRVKSNVPDLYWRGKTFSTYTSTDTGREFKNPTIDAASRVIHAADEHKPPTDPPNKGYSFGDSPAYGEPREFLLGPAQYDLPTAAMPKRREIKQTVMVQTASTDNLYAAGEILRATTTAPELKTYPDGEVATSEPLTKGATYDVVSTLPRYDSQDSMPLRAVSSSPQAVPPAIRDVYTTTRVWDEPSGSWLGENPNLRSIADGFTKGITNNYDKVVAIQKNITAACRYNLRAKAVPRGLDAVEYFLTVSHEGYCTDFAAAMTMLCRYAGVPARMARGYLPGDLQDGTYIVRDKHYHVWTEVFFPKIGWVSFDATDGTQEVPPPDPKKALHGPTFLAWLFSHGGLPPAIGLLVIALIGYVFKAELLDRLGWRRASGRGLLDRPPTNVAIVNAYLQACDVLRRRGMPRLDFQTPDEYADLVGARTAAVAGGVGHIMADLTRLYNQYRYGAGVARDTDVQTALQNVVDLKSVMHGIKL